MTYTIKKKFFLHPNLKKVSVKKIDKNTLRMKKIYIVKCNIYRKFENPKISYIFKKTSVLFIICDKCSSNNDTIYRKKNLLRLKICIIIAGIKKHKSIIKKKKKMHDKIVSLAKTKLNTLEVLIFKALIDSNISHEEFFSVIGVLKEYNNMKEAFVNLDRR